MRVVIKNKEYGLVFKFSLLLALSKLWEEPYVEKVIERLNIAGNTPLDDKGNPIAEVSMPFQFFEDLLDVVKISAKQAGNAIDATDDEIVDDLFENMDVIQNVLKGLISAMPQVKKSVNPEVRESKK